ncbi:hypothetical protein [Streptomyces europaeiscabiei]|uniref:hypothetical protein n=1 Tax=Streptomyces europaeiscabiei TaxID=146819 RepID=UPI0038F5DA93
MSNTEQKIQAPTTNTFGLMATPAVPCPAGQGRKVRITIDPTHPRADAAADEQRTNALAAALYIAQYGYRLAITSPNPAARLDDMCDAVAELWDDITPRLPKKFAGADREFAETMQAAVADRLWAFTAVEYARIEAGDGYGYLFDLLADGLKRGADPQTIRTAALAAPQRIRDLVEQSAA